MEPKEDSSIPDEEVFKIYFKYHQSTFNKVISSNDQIYKFKEKIRNYEKIFKEIQTHKFKQKVPGQIMIYVKEDNKTKIYTEEIKETQEPKEPEQKKKEEKPEEKHQRSFLVLGGYPDIAEALERRGWKKITDEDDTSFDFIYSLKSAKIHFEELKPNQMTNHFWKANNITRKAGLVENLRNLYFKGVVVDNFFPRAFKISERNDLEDFLEDFKTQKALGILKKCVESGGKNCNKEMVETALNIIKKKEKFFCNELNVKEVVDKVEKKLYNDKEAQNDCNFPLITDEEWAIIGEEDMEVYKSYVEKLQRQKILSAPEGSKTSKASGKHKSSIRQKIEESSHHAQEKEEEKDDDDDDDDESPDLSKPVPKIKSHPRPEPKPKTDDLSSRVEEIKALLEKLAAFLPQNSLDGSNNIWIAKPGGLSRGRGIYCIDQINDILSNIKICGQTIVQKYIENPLIILGRKFDIRQWVLVTNLTPLTVWLFDTPYLRFGAEDFKLTEFKNIYSHLTNNSIAKHSEKFHEDTKIEGDMWEIESFRKFLVENYGKDYWPEIQEKIKKIVIYSLQSAKHKIFHRKNCMEVFGYDIMIDTKLNVYLIEINASPDWTYSTKVTEKLVKEMSDDIMKVVVDYGDEMKKDEKDRKPIDTGKLRMIFSSNDFPKFDNMKVNYNEVNPV